MLKESGVPDSMNPPKTFDEWLKVCQKVKDNVYIIISLMVIPVAVLIVPLFILYTRTRLMRTYQGLIIIYTAVCMPFSVYLLTNFLKTVPDEIMEASIIDGYSLLKTLAKVVIPFSGPPITILIIVNAL